MALLPLTCATESRTKMFLRLGTPDGHMGQKLLLAHAYCTARQDIGSAVEAQYKAAVAKPCTK